MIDATAPRSVLIMAGGTGGHVFPALAAAHSLQQQGIQVEWLGTRRGIEARLVPAANIPIHYITVSGLRGKGIVDILKACYQVVVALWQSLKVLRQVRPVCVLGMGGFASGPGGLAAWLSGKPLVIHEQNAVAGTTNRLLAKLARRVLQGYPLPLGGDKGEHIGNPVRGEIVRLPVPSERGIGSTGNLKLLVLGGSLGAKPINDILPATLAQMDETSRPEVWHQAGRDHDESVRALYQQHDVRARVEAFVDDMASAYAWADIVICRAGALTVAELSAAGTAAVMVPLPYAIDDHQTANARWLSDDRAGILLPQSEMTVKNLSNILQQFHTDRSALLAMASKARAKAKTDAAEQVAATCLEVADG